MCPHRKVVPSGRPVGRLAVVLCGLAALAVVETGCAQVIRRPDVVIGTATPVEIDYPLGASTCRLLNLETSRHGLRCAEELSAGPVANIESLRRDRIDVGIVASDVLADAVAGRGTFVASSSAGDLRVLFAGHLYVLTLVAHRDAEIQSVADLRGKRISIGTPGSRQRSAMERVMAALGLERNDFAEVLELSPAEQNRAFCANELDAIVYSVAHPNGLIRDATLTCGGTLVDVSGPAIDRMLSAGGNYERTVIQDGTYPASPAEVRAFGVRAIVVATTRMPDAMAYEIVSAVFGRLDDFRVLHPAFAALSTAEMIQTTWPAPLHSGAARYYRERGWPP
jgi:TRAP transporter TAXI family solute receptor